MGKIKVKVIDLRGEEQLKEVEQLCIRYLDEELTEDQFNELYKLIEVKYECSR